MHKIFGIGLSRTGTRSCWQLMKTLGFKSIHLPVSMQQIELFSFANETTVAARFEELGRLYPNSKFIYTTRDREEWVASCLIWFKEKSLQRWFHDLPSDRARHWVSDSVRILYGRDCHKMAEISREELRVAYARHERRVLNYFRQRPDDLLTVDVTDGISMPFTKVVSFLEHSGLLAIPQGNSSRPSIKQTDGEQVANEVTLFRQTDSRFLAEGQLRLARVWHRKGNLEAARKKYEKTLWLVPDHVAATHGLGELLLQHGMASEAAQVFRRGLKTHPNESVLHKGLVNALEKQNNIESAFRHYQLTRKDQKEIAINNDDIVCCLAVRNEVHRLPFFLSYYRKLGVSRFFVIDNDSTDDTVDFLQRQPDVYTWHSPLSFNEANFGSAWFEVLLRSYAQDNWCLIVDIDELFCFVDYERRSLVELCADLDDKQKKAVNAILLDMYSEQSVEEVRYTEGQDFRKLCPYFDRQFYHTKYENAGPYNNQTLYFGGVRQRVFGKQGEYLLSKVPLLRYSQDSILAGGQHWTNYPAKDVALESGCLLHFKFLAQFRDYVEQEVQRKQHYGNARQYQQYARALSKNRRLTLYDPRHSVKLVDSQQLLRYGILNAKQAVCEPPAEPKISFPQIKPLPPTSTRPFWSVMITVYNRVTHLERAIQSVVNQAPGREKMQIEVVSDGSDEITQSRIAEIVDTTAGERVVLHQQSRNLGHPYIFNLCLGRAHGQWIHILHDDDWVKPGFYDALEAGIRSQQDIGVAFCRGIQLQALGLGWASWLERAAPGVIDNWLERIALMCRLQFSSVVVKREAYEELGGFTDEVGSAFDWDMWKRVATRYPVWFEPQILAVISRNDDSETDSLLTSGEQVDDSRKSIDFSSDCMPAIFTDEVSNRAKEHLAVRALTIAEAQLESGAYEAAVANIRAGLKCSRSEKVRKSLASLLVQSRE